MQHAECELSVSVGVLRSCAQQPDSRTRVCVHAVAVEPHHGQQVERLWLLLTRAKHDTLSCSVVHAGRVAEVAQVFAQQQVWQLLL